MGKRANVVIVDDSPTMRRLVARLISADPRLQVVGEAGDPFEAREVIKSTSPDVLTLDVEMPRMDGISFLDKIMRLRPMPVVMLSTETHRGSAAAVEALARGAVDCIGKPVSGAAQDLSDLADRVFAASQAKVRARETRTAAAPSADYRSDGRLVLIGASTGGVDALEQVLTHWPANGPPTLITQHMPMSFLESFARRLDGRLATSVRLAAQGDHPTPGQVLIAAGGAAHLELRQTGAGPRCNLVKADPYSGHRPSVDRLMLSSVPFANQCLGVLLTGMGRDGAEGLSALRQAGAWTIGQDEASSVVYGMPRVAFERGGVSEQLSLSKIGARVIELTGQGALQRRPQVVGRS